MGKVTRFPTRCKLLISLFPRRNRVTRTLRLIILRELLYKRAQCDYLVPDAYIIMDRPVRTRFACLL